MARLPFGLHCPPAARNPAPAGIALGLPRSSGERALSPADEREPLLLAYLVDDLEDTGVEPRVLDAELLGQPAPVHQIVSGFLTAALVGEGDPRVRDEPAHDVRQLTQAHRDAARVVEAVAGGVDHDLHVVDGAADLVRPGDIGRTHADDRHAVVLDVLPGLELVEDLVHRVLAGAVHRIVLVHQPVAEVTLLTAHRDRARVDDALDAGQARGLEAVVHAEDVEAHDLVRVALAGAETVGEVDEALGLHVEHGPHHVLELRDVPADDGRADRLAGERRRSGVQVHAHDRFAARDQPLDEPWADEAGRPDHQHRHTVSPNPAVWTARRSSASGHRPWRRPPGSG